jgi:hypothetical protein
VHKYIEVRVPSSDGNEIGSGCLPQIVSTVGHAWKDYNEYSDE